MHTVFPAMFGRRAGPKQFFTFANRWARDAARVWLAAYFTRRIAARCTGTPSSRLVARARSRAWLLGRLHPPEQMHRNGTNASMALAHGCERIASASRAAKPRRRAIGAGELEVDYRSPQRGPRCTARRARRRRRSKSAPCDNARIVFRGSRSAASCERSAGSKCVAAPRRGRAGRTLHNGPKSEADSEEIGASHATHVCGSRASRMLSSGRRQIVSPARSWVVPCCAARESSGFREW